MPRLTTPQKTKAAPADRAELNHHLVENRGYWWVCCSINATPRTKEKLGFSLCTKCLETARKRRDAFLNGLHEDGLEVRIRRRSAVTLGLLKKLPPDRADIPWQKRVEDVLAKARSVELDAPKAKRVKTPRNSPAREACCA
jgi:hypothetical protein